MQVWLTSAAKGGRRRSSEPWSRVFAGGSVREGGKYGAEGSCAKQGLLSSLLSVGALLLLSFSSGIQRGQSHTEIQAVGSLVLLCAGLAHTDPFRGLLASG